MSDRTRVVDTRHEGLLCLACGLDAAFDYETEEYVCTSGYCEDSVATCECCGELAHACTCEQVSASASRAA